MPMTLAPGQIVGQGDWDALFTQHGGMHANQQSILRQPTPEEKAAATKAAAAAAPFVEGTEPDPNDPRTWNVRYETNPIYRYNLVDGSSVEARTAPDGLSWQVVSYTPSQKFQQTQAPAAQQGQPVGSIEDTDKAGNTRKVTTYKRPDGTTYDVVDSVSHAPKPATRNETPVTVNGKNLIKVETVDPATGQSKTVLLDPVTRAEVQAPEPPKPAPQAVSAPSNQRQIAQRNATTGEIEFVPNKNYVPDQKLVTDPITGRWRVLTEDANGNLVLQDVTDRTTIKPNDIPVLQAKYGQIGQSLGALLADLNGRVSRGEMTPQERDAAFKGAHQQAEVQVNEINSILDNSKAVWTSQIQERGQTFGEAANRRSFASSIMNNAVDTGRTIAQGALPGHGRAIAEGVMTLMDMGQRYAGGMGGFPSMAPTPLPPALQQAAGMNLPGFGPEAGGPPPPGPAAAPPSGADVAAANAATQAQSVAAFGGLGIPPPGGAPPAGRPAPLLPPPPPVPGSTPAAPPLGLAPATGGPTPSPLPFTGQDPSPTPLGSPLGGLGSMFGAGMAASPIGVPASAGGGGLFDPSLEGQGMLSASMTGGYGGAGVADPDWERAVRAAMGLFG